MFIILMVYNAVMSVSVCVCEIGHIWSIVLNMLNNYQ